MNKYVLTELACELSQASKTDKTSSQDVDFSSTEMLGYKIQRMNIKTQSEKILSSAAKGRYSTIYFDNITEMADEQKNALSYVISHEISSMFPKKLNEILVGGLGNQSLTSDSIGPKTISKLAVTRHLSMYDPKLFEKLSINKISALAPGVMAQTGMESAEIFMGAANIIKPDVIITVDSLCARNLERLARTVQISDTGVTPGSGIGNKRKKIDKELTGCRVISIGIPTVVSSSTLIYDALEKCEIEYDSDKTEQLLKNGRSFYVTLNEIDTVTDEISEILADAIYRSASKEEIIL